MLNDLVELNNQIVALNQRFDSANEGLTNLTVDMVVDSVMTILPLLKNAKVQIDSTADLSIIVTALGDLQVVTNQAKVGLEYVDPAEVVQVISQMLDLIIPVVSEGVTSEKKKVQPQSHHEAHKETPKESTKK